MTSADDTEARSARACLRLKWPLLILTIAVVPLWLIAAWLALFLTTMASGGGSTHPWTFADYFLNIITLSLVALAIPIVGVFFGWYGNAIKKAGVMLAGTLILFAWIGAGAGWYGLSRLNTYASRNPGNWADWDFQIPSQDRQTYKIVRYANTLSITLPNVKLLYPDASPTTGVPQRATAQIGHVVLRGITPMARQICDGNLHQIDFTEETQNPENPDEFINLFGTVREFADVFMSAKRDWFASCLVHKPLRQFSRCEVVFINKGWVSQFIVEGTDLCKAPDMNGRFVALIEKWRRH